MLDEETLNYIENVIRNNAISEEEDESINYYSEDSPINLSSAKYIFHGLNEIMKKYSANGAIYYSWLDPQSGQIRISFDRDGNIQKHFNRKIVIQEGFDSMINDIYEEGSIFEKNGGILVCIAK